MGHVRTSGGPSTSYSKSYCFGSFQGTRPPAKGYEECGRIVCMCVKGALGGDLGVTESLALLTVSPAPFLPL